MAAPSDRIERVHGDMGRPSVASGAGEPRLHRHPQIEEIKSLGGDVGEEAVSKK